MTRFVDVIDRNGRRTQIPADWLGARLGNGYTLADQPTATETPTKTAPKRDTKKEA